MTVTQNYTFQLFIWNNRRQQWLFSTTFTASVSDCVKAFEELVQRNLDFYKDTFPNRVFRIYPGENSINSKIPPLCVFNTTSYYDFCRNAGERFPASSNEVHFSVDDDDNVSYILTRIGKSIPGITLMSVIQEIVL